MYIDSLIADNSGSDVVITGNMNFACSNDKPGLSMFLCLQNWACKDISFCDNLLSQYSYVSESVGNMSLIDNFFMSNNLKNHPIRLKLIGFGANLSDHKPPNFVLNVINLNGPTEDINNSFPDRLKPAAMFSVRWGKCNKLDYYFTGLH